MSAIGIATFIAYVIGLLISMTIGGNYFTDFHVFGVQGYEATGLLGGYIFAVVGGVFLAKYFAKHAYSFSQVILPTLAMTLMSFLVAQITSIGEFTLFAAYFPVFFAMSLGTDQKEEKQYFLFATGVVLMLMLILAVAR
jgi:hypothetical protein